MCTDAIHFLAFINICKTLSLREGVLSEYIKNEYRAPFVDCEKNPRVRDINGLLLIVARSNKIINMAQNSYCGHLSKLSIYNLLGSLDSEM